MEMGRRDLMKRGGTDKKSGSGFTAKSKKRMLKKLKEEMIYHSDLENEVSKKKSKLPKKNLKVTNGVDHASVPRKLRSAMMKKRNLESVSKVSSVSKRLNRFKSESCKKELAKEEDQELVGVVSDSMMISNDEKEVAETLYGLAGMITDETEAIGKKTCHEKEDSKLESVSTQAEPVVSVLSSAKTKELDAKPLVQSDNLGMVDGIDGLKQSSSDASAKVLETKVALWPGLSSGAQVHSKSLSTKLPPWMGQAASPSMSTSLLSEPLRVQPKKLKRCASHVYISRLIKFLQTSKTSPTMLDQIEQRSSETSERKLLDPVTTISDFKTMVSPVKIYQNPHLFDKHRTHNPKPVPEDRTPLALDFYGPHTSKKQSYDFLTLSSSGPTQSHHLPLPNPSLQYHLSAAYNSHLSPATSSHQLSPYLASRFQTAYNANQQQQQQLQKRLWAATQYRPQYSKPNLSLNLTNIQQPLQVVSQQKHRLMAATAAAMSMNHHHNNNPSRTVMNRSQEHHYPFTYEDTKTSLQLLCNELS